MIGPISGIKNYMQVAPSFAAQMGKPSTDSATVSGFGYGPSGDSVELSDEAQEEAAATPRSAHASASSIDKKLADVEKAIAALSALKQAGANVPDALLQRLKQLEMQLQMAAMGKHPHRPGQGSPTTGPCKGALQTRPQPPKNSPNQVPAHP